MCYEIVVPGLTALCLTNFFLSYTTDMIVERSAHWHVSRRYSSAVGSLAEKEEEQ